MIRNETFQNGACIAAEIIDLQSGTVSQEIAGQITDVRPITDAERVFYGPQPLDPVGALATLLAVTETLTTVDAANAVGLQPEDLIAEAEAWRAAKEIQP